MGVAPRLQLARLSRMAWEWVAPVVTGIVGVSGIAGTYLNGRRQTTSPCNSRVSNGLRTALSGPTRKCS